MFGVQCQILAFECEVVTFPSHKRNQNLQQQKNVSLNQYFIKRNFKSLNTEVLLVYMYISKS